MRDRGLIFDPISILGGSVFDAIAIIVLGVFVVIVFVLLLMKRRTPYRIILKTDYDSGELWRLERLVSWWEPDSWEEVYRSKGKEAVKEKAREALYAHCNFREFIESSDSDRKHL